MRLIIAAALAALCLSAPAADRSRSARAEVMRHHPCPSTGARRGACPGHVVDHIIPLCAGGPDAPSNMQWQTLPDAKAKDREEAAMCRKRKS